jgi:putative transposase
MRKLIETANALVKADQIWVEKTTRSKRILKVQIHIPRARIPTQPIILSPEEKAELLRIATKSFRRT